MLVLGLDGSGKSTFLRVLSGKPPLEGHVPTWGFNSVRLPTKDFEVDLLESEQTTPPHTHTPFPYCLSWTQAEPLPGRGSKMHVSAGKSFPRLPGARREVQAPCFDVGGPS